MVNVVAVVGLVGTVTTVLAGLIGWGLGIERGKQIQRQRNFRYLEALGRIANDASE